MVVIGDLIGSGSAQEQAIVGETPNLAARLQGIAKPNTVVISEGTRRLLGNLFDLEDLGPQDLTFASFVVGLSTEALALMGEMPHPATGERMRDLVGAQQLIDIIGILQDKTRGNLSHDEDTLLDAILFDLRMKYVEKARQTPR